MDLKPQQLRAFFYAYRLRSLSKAGEQMRIPPASVGRLLKQMESILGQRLFDRSSDALKSTAVGDEVIVIVERILEDMRHLHAAAFGDRRDSAPS